MLGVNKILLIIGCFVNVLTQLYAQQKDSCNIKIRFIAQTELHSHGITVRCVEQEKEYFINEQNEVVADGFCKQKYHFQFSIQNDVFERRYIDLQNDTTISFTAPLHLHELAEVSMFARKNPTSLYVESILKNATIVENGYQDFSALLKGMAGVDVLRSGTGVSKPIVNGLWGNRVEIYNHGIAQSGQQWGVDHAPEVDAFTADNITVLRGANALAYSQKSLGGILFLNSSKIKNDDPHLHGQLNYFYGTNGRDNILNTRIQKYSNIVAWQFIGTFKLNGDKQTPNYYLTNSGRREYDISLRLEKKINSWFHTFYGSIFSTDLGIFKGSQIGNVTDLQNALHASVPLFVKPDFSFGFSAPDQEVAHQLLKWETEFSITKTSRYLFIAGFQRNQRKEFDLKRDYVNRKLALGLEQFTFNGEINYKNTYQTKWNIFTGYQIRYEWNENNSSTANYPLIPDYTQLINSIFFITSKRWNNFLIELGGRTSYRHLIAFPLRQPFGTGFDIYNHDNFMASATFNSKWEYTRDADLEFSLSYISRSAEINELYSFGVHQGVSSIEEGNSKLDNEKLFQFNVSHNLHLFKHVLFQSYFFVNQFQNYIFLNPQRELRLTIRGAFPVFVYQQAKALMYGFDFLLQLGSFKYANINLKYSYIKGINQTDKIPLVYIPPQKILNTYIFFLPKGFQFKTTLNYVFKQYDLLDKQDYLPPPNSYFLLDLEMSKKIQIRKIGIKVAVETNNLLNETYRDYLNRQRYFADEMGRNIIFRINMEF